MSGPKSPPRLITRLEESYCLGNYELYPGTPPAEIKAEVKDPQCQRILTDAYYLRTTCRTLFANLNHPLKWMAGDCLEFLNLVLGLKQSQKNVVITCDAVDLGTLFYFRDYLKMPGVLVQCNELINTALATFEQLRQK